MAIADKCSEATFSLTGDNEAERIEGVGRFKYIGRLLDWSDNDWLEFLQNIRKSRHIWGRLGKLLRGEGAEPTVPEMFYCAVVKVVLLFGAKTWVLTDTMIRQL